MKYVAKEYEDLLNKKYDFDVVMPKENENEFIDLALLLGYKEILFLSNDINYTFKSDKIKVLRGFLLKNTNELQKTKQRFDYVFAAADRKFFEIKTDFIFNSELSDRNDSVHYRSTLLNQVHAKLSKENSIGIIFNFSLLYDESSRGKYLGRMIQNAKLIRKYKLKYAIFSFAKEPLMMRSKATLFSLSKNLGL